jgi:hypothetical protein
MERISRRIFKWWPHTFFLLNIFLWVTWPFHRLTFPLCRLWRHVFGSFTRPVQRDYGSESEEEEEMEEAEDLSGVNGEA